ncbi:MAG: thioesterase [Verrucomicrobia bacterium RIFCSPLOWO2_12_FULL_64_8]|nr:MAG: thioesterase [Verrucomicrobia bacterium RIFCSPLOWO2_12_FULL_64_8]
MFSYHRTIRFADTDAAGVVFFANYLAICHEAYEEALAEAVADLKTLFADHGFIVPIVKSQAEYLRPLSCGDKVRVTLSAAPLGDDSFALDFELHRLGPPEKLAARVRTEHVCISSKTRKRQPLPPPLAAWVKGAGA